MTNPSDYLDEVADRLPFVDVVTDEVITELADFIEDATADLVDRGYSSVDAWTDVERRLGPPGELAESLRRARQTNRRILAAVGGGGFFSLTIAFRGMIVATASFLVPFVGLFLARWLVTGSTFDERFFGSVEVASLLFGLWLIAYSVGRATPFFVAQVSGRSFGSARAWMYVTGVCAALVYWFGYATQMPVWAVPGFAVVPVLFFVGVFRARQYDWRPTNISFRTYGMLISIALGLLLIGVAAAPPAYELSFYTHPDKSTLSIVANTVDLADPDFEGAIGSGDDPSLVVIHLPATITHAQIEVWQATPDLERIDASDAGPLYAAPAEPDTITQGGLGELTLLGMTFRIGGSQIPAYVARVDSSARRAWPPVWLVAVGLTTDGERTVLEYWAPDQPHWFQFTGSVVDWVNAK